MSSFGIANFDKCLNLMDVNKNEKIADLNVRYVSPDELVAEICKSARKAT